MSCGWTGLCDKQLMENSQKCIRTNFSLRLSLHLYLVQLLAADISSSMIARL